MLRIECDLISQSPISFSRPVQEQKEPRESDDAFEQRIWRERLHVNDEGHLYSPAMGIKHAMVSVSKYLAEKVRGKGNKTYSKFFESGVLVIRDLVLCDVDWNPLTVEDALPERLFLNADGIRGGGKRVWRTYPVVVSWRAKTVLVVHDERLCSEPEKVIEYLERAGMLIGLGRWRIENGGLNGQFRVENVAINDMAKVRAA